MFDRIKNLWKLSAYRPLEVGEKTEDLPVGSKVVGAIVAEPVPQYPVGPAVIVDTTDATVQQDFPAEPEDQGDV